MRMERKGSALGAAAAILAGVSGVSAQDFVYPNSGSLTQVYWTRVTYTSSGYHKGLDIAVGSGNPVVASRGGTVGFAAWSTVGYGNLVILNHEASYQTYYGHNSKFAVAKGQAVALKQQIAWVGSTGNSTGPHVHWEVRRYGTPVYIPGTVWSKVTLGNTLVSDYPDLAPLDGQPPPPSGTVLFKAKITATSLNVRGGPGSGYPIVGSLSYGAVVDVYESTTGWYRILYGGSWAWISAAYTVVVTSSDTVLFRAKVTAGTLNVRSGPGSTYAIVGSLAYGAIVDVYEVSNGGSTALTASWYRILYGGAYRWISGAYTVRL